ncbi:histidine phosphatase superfamily [Cadophora sp. MPI-SDFR-AT-0126]|nr:histidine phosphatase superfamily [Leotiomycetes sp. MPI-SDFR-AT-0126]
MRNTTKASLGLLIHSTTAQLNSTVAASSFVGATTANTYPPSGTSVNPSLFPSEPIVGFPGPTPTGAEPAAIQTAAAYPYNNGPANQFPLVAPQQYGKGEFSDNFNIAKNWGNLSPCYSVSSADYGLPDASPLVPEGCSIVQMHLLYRHGARYPTTGGAPSTFAEKLQNATRDGGFNVTSELAELLAPFGRSQLFNLGIAYRQLYGELLNNFTEAGTIPIFRTESQDRMYQQHVNIEILVESPGVNNSGAPYDVCPNSNIKSRGSIGSSVAEEFAKNAFNSTISRLPAQVSGVNFTATDAVAMLQLCSYETNALGYSKFCTLFSEEDFLTYEYYYDLTFYYNNGPGSPVSAAQGKSYLQEWVARLTHTFPSPTSALNETFDNTTTFFPLNNSIYADATHEVVVLDTLTAFNLTALFKGLPLDPKDNQHSNVFVTSKQVPFATHFTTQVLECPAYTPTRQIRFIVNDAVVLVAESYSGCSDDPNGLCSLDTVISVLQDRILEIDYDYDCFANYTANAGIDYNGRAPR